MQQLPKLPAYSFGLFGIYITCANWYNVLYNFDLDKYIALNSFCSGLSFDPYAELYVTGIMKGALAAYTFRFSFPYHLLHLGIAAYDSEYHNHLYFLSPHSKFPEYLDMSRIFSWDIPPIWIVPYRNIPLTQTQLQIIKAHKNVKYNYNYW